MNVDRISHFITEPYHLLGFLFLIVAGISIYTGKTLTRGQGLVSRHKEPKTFWLLVAVWFSAGVVFIGGFWLVDKLNDSQSDTLANSQLRNISILLIVNC